MVVRAEPWITLSQIVELEFLLNGIHACPHYITYLKRGNLDFTWEHKKMHFVVALSNTFTTIVEEKQKLLPFKELFSCDPGYGRASVMFSFLIVDIPKWYFPWLQLSMVLSKSFILYPCHWSVCRMWSFTSTETSFTAHSGVLYVDWPCYWL